MSIAMPSGFAAARSRGSRGFPAAIFASLLCLPIAGPVMATTVYHVRADATSGGDGLSWATAFQSLEVALDVADPQGGGAPVPTEIWVAAGTYLPATIYGGDPRNRSFWLANNVAVLGGFTGDETSADQRDPQLNVTILSGDINIPGDFSDNCYHLVRSASSHNATSVLDGFTITAANANGPEDRGAGILCEGAPVFVRCRVLGNFAQFRGAGAQVSKAATFIECVFESNSGGTQGAAGLHSTSAQLVTLTDCAFLDNSGGSIGALSGGFVASGCSFVGNSGGGTGAVSGAGTFRDCLFQDNSCVFNGGGAIGIGTSPLTTYVVGCDFIGNSGGGNNGGAIGASSVAGLVVHDCRFLGNSIGGGRGGAIWVGSFSGSANIAGCVFVGNSAALGGAMSIESASASVSCCTVAGNSATAAAGGVRFEGSQKALSNSILWDNAVGADVSQAAQIVAPASVVVRRCCIQGWTGSLGGVDNFGLDPLLVNVKGPDLIAGTADDDPRLSPGSPCIDSGDNALVPADAGDVDLDGNVAEPLPIDVEGLPRFFDDPRSPDGGAGTPPIVDRGAHEFDGPDEADPPGLFVGPPGGSWFDARNWAGGAVPGPDTVVTLPGQAVIAGGAAVAQSIEIAPGGALTVLDGSLIANALLIRGGATLEMHDAMASIVLSQILTERDADLAWISGTITVQGGAWLSDVAIELGCFGPATLRLVDAGAEAPAIHLCGDGRLEASGAIAAAVQNDGVLAPGGSIGTTVIDGSYAQGPGGLLEIEASGYAPGTGHDLLLVNGAASLDGGVHILTDDLAPLLGGVQRFLSAASATGRFSSFQMMALDRPFAGFLTMDSTGAQATTTLASSAPRLHVDASAPAGGDGQSWATATRSLDGALTVAASLPGSIDEVWVVAGTYVPTQRENAADPRSVSFRPVDGVAVLGGFVGDETEASQRDPVANTTTLSGDLLGNDVHSMVPANATLDDNAYHVLRLQDLGTGSRLDGFTVAGGNAAGGGSDDFGGGLDITGGAPVIAALRVVNNRAFLGGGGARLSESAATFQNCHFEDNAALGNQMPTYARGAALLLEGGTPAIADCSFAENAVLSLGSGLAIFASGGEILVEGSSFHSHVGTNVVRGEGEAALTVLDSVFSGNTGGGDGRALFAIGGTVHLQSCIFDGNSAAGFGGSGGAVALSGGSHLIADCEFIGNGAGDGGAMRLTASGPLDGGLVQVVDCLFEGNSSQGSGGAVSNDGALAAFYENCQFLGNSAALDGGALHNEDFAEVSLASCTFTGNSALGAGGGVHHANDGKTILIDSSFSGNAASIGSGLYNWRGLVVGTASLADGDDFHNASGLRPGGVAPSPIVGTISIAGDYTHAELVRTGSVTPVLVMDVTGPAAGLEHDVLLVEGSATIQGGSLVVNLAEGFLPRVGQTFDLISASSISGTFDAVGVASGVPGISVEITYEPQVVRATVVAVEPPRFSDPLITDLDGLPRDATLLDIDADGDLDLALAIEDPGPEPGKLFILRNRGSTSSGDWMGFEDAPLVTGIADEPTAIAGGDLTGDGLPEIILANEQSATLSIVLNFGGSLFLLDGQTYIGGQVPAVGVGDFVGDGLLDVIAADQSAGALDVFAGVGFGSIVFEQMEPAGAAPRRLRVQDIDLDGDDDVVVANTSDLFDNPPPLLTVHRFDGELLPAESYPMGRGTTGLELGLLNQDALPDVVVANRLDSSLTIAEADGTDPGRFHRPGAVPLSGEPFSIAASDLDGDGDADIAAVIKRPEEPLRLVAVLNTTRSEGPLTLMEGKDIPTKQDPELVFAGDVDGNGVGDLVVVSYFAEAPQGGVAGAPLARVSVLLAESTVVPGDLDGDGVVGGADLGLLLAAWGGTQGPADLDGSGIVDGGDLGLLLAAWTPG